MTCAIVAAAKTGRDGDVGLDESDCVWWFLSYHLASQLYSSLGIFYTFLNNYFILCLFFGKIHKEERNNNNKNQKIIFSYSAQAHSISRLHTHTHTYIYIYIYILGSFEDRSWQAVTIRMSITPNNNTYPLIPLYFNFPIFYIHKRRLSLYKITHRAWINRFTIQHEMSTSFRILSLPLAPSPFPPLFGLTV